MGISLKNGDRLLGINHHRTLEPLPFAAGFKHRGPELRQYRRIWKFNSVQRDPTVRLTHSL
jgi:hypothetical protein